MNAPTETMRAAESDLSVLKGRRVVVLGLGESGCAMAVYASERQAQVSVVDTRENPPGSQQLQASLPDVTVVRQELSEVDLNGVDILAWSPGLSKEVGDGRQLYERAIQSGVIVAGELDLFMAAFSADNRARATNEQQQAVVVGVTGTNGKTTVTRLAGLLAEAAGVNVQCAGNIGPAMLDAWRDAATRDDLPDLWILELSSFQLALATEFDPDAAVVLNIGQDHLDWHESMQSYASAKQRVSGGKTIAFALRGAEQTCVAQCAEQRTIGLDEPARIGDFGMVNDGGIAWLAWAVPAELPIPGKKTKTTENALVKRLMPAEVLKITGSHNHLNALAALAVCDAVGVPIARMLHALPSYKGEIHRCEFLAVIDGIEYYNDSKGTNVAATVAALDGLDRPCWLLAGGIGKEQDFSLLADAVARRAVGVLLFGRDAALIGEALSGTGIEVGNANSLADALGQARAQAHSGQAILLSPACSSFDMFANYQQRGEAFRELVQELALESGTGLELPC